MKQILLMIAVVVLVVGCSKESQKTTSNKLIVDPYVELEIREVLKKPEGKLTEADLAKIITLEFNGTVDDDLNELNITDAGLKDVAKLQQLTKLDLFTLWGSKITDEGIKEVAKLQNLTELNLKNHAITDGGLKEVATLQKLTELNLEGTKITDAGLKEVAKLQKLERLLLNHTQITDEGLKEVAKLKQLTWLMLIDTKVSKAGVAELKKALPRCTIASPPNSSP